MQKEKLGNKMILLYYQTMFYQENVFVMGTYADKEIKTNILLKLCPVYSLSFHFSFRFS